MRWSARANGGRPSGARPVTSLLEETETLVFTDIVGSVGLWQRDPDAMAHAQERHDVILREVIARCRGTLIKQHGDGVFALFRTAADGVAAACAAQVAVNAEPWPAAARLAIRCAVHSGRCIHRHGDCFGTPVNLCARLRDAGHGGQILVSECTRSMALDHLPPDIGFVRLGRHHLRGLAEPVGVFQVTHPALAGSFPPLRLADDADWLLPAETNPLIGRVTESARLLAVLDEHRLVTIVGPAGVGKSRLALHVARRLLSDRAGGVWYLDALGWTDVQRLVDALGRALTVPTETAAPLVDCIAAELRDEQALVVLDNCDGLVGALGPVVERLLAGASGLRLLASAREPIGLRGEQLFSVTPLAVAPSDTLRPGRGLLGYDAVRLFVERARSRLPDHLWTARELATVSRICTALDGLPLAIELAAGQVHAIGLGALAERIQSHGAGIEATMASSLERLDDHEREVFVCLGVFEGGFDLAAALYVTAVRHDGASDRALESLSHLVDLSLVMVAPTRGGDYRYRLLEPIRQGALALMGHTKRAQEARRQHAEFYLGLAERAAQGLRGADQELWLSRLEAEHGNLLAALRGASGGASWRQDPGTALRMAAALASFWYLHGHLRLGREMLRQVLAEPPAPDLASVRAAAANGAGVLAQFAGDYLEANGWFDESLRIRRALGDQLGESQVLNNLGMVAFEQGDYKAAREFYARSAALKRDAGDERGLAVALHNIAGVALETGDYADARGSLEEALSIRRSLEDHWGIAAATAAHGYLEHLTGRRDLARRHYRTSLRLQRSLGDRQGEAQTILRLGEVEHAEGQLTRAKERYLDALAKETALGNRRSLAVVKLRLGQLYLDEGAVAAARTLLCESLVLATGAHRPRGVASALLVLAHAGLTTGDVSGAARQLAEAMARFEELGVALETCRGLEATAVVAARVGRAADARELLAAAQWERVRLGAPRSPMETERLTKWLGAPQEDGADGAEIPLDGGSRPPLALAFGVLSAAMDCCSRS